MKEIADFIIKTVQEESTGHQLAVSYHEVGRKFRMIITKDTPTINYIIADELISRESVLELCVDEYGFNVTLNQDYVLTPNDERELIYI